MARKQFSFDRVGEISLKALLMRMVSLVFQHEPGVEPCLGLM